MNSKRIGRQTVALQTPPSVLSFANIGGRMEGQGPLAKYFDELCDDSFFGEKTWEKAEATMQRRVLRRTLEQVGLKPGDVDWDYIFGTLGVRWLHTGGIFAALSETTAEVVIEAVKAAKKYGTIVSYDLNYRPSLWKGIGGQARAQEVNKEIAPYIDVMIGNEEDFTACLGFEVEGNDANLKSLNLDGYVKMLGEVCKTYPNFKVIATTLRTVKTATVNDWSAMVYADGKVTMGMSLPGLEIYDRVGGGDSFASGLIYGLMTYDDAAKAVNYGIAHGALAMTTPGDTSTASLKEVEKIVGGAGARVDR